MTKVRSSINKPIQQVTHGQQQLATDSICIEEPLEIIVPFISGSDEIEYRTIAITMRTPGDDINLARGFLFSEGIIQSAKDISRFTYCSDKGDAGTKNSLQVHMRTPLNANDHQIERNFTTYSSCGLCGKTSIKSLEMQSPPELDEQHEVIDVQFIETLSTKMLKKQPLFNQTGSAHASGLFNYSGELIVVYEDIGRHNALDKLVGHCLEKSQDQLKQSVLLVSGRASFELVQKAIRASIPIMLSVGAPSSLAVETAKRFNLTLIGFIKANRFNVYHAPWRIKFG